MDGDPLGTTSAGQLCGVFQHFGPGVGLHPPDQPEPLQRVEAQTGSSLARLNLHFDVAAVVAHAEFDLPELRVPALGDKPKAGVPPAAHPDGPAPRTGHLDEQLVALLEAARPAIGFFGSFEAEHFHGGDHVGIGGDDG